MGKNCDICGATLTTGARFCANCGAPVREIESNQSLWVNEESKQQLQAIHEKLQTLSKALRTTDIDAKEEYSFIEEAKALQEPLRLMILGEFSAGKSTFINALAGEEIAAVGALETTAVITELCYGKQDEIIVHYDDGQTKHVSKEEYAHLTVESKGSVESRRSVDYIERRLPLRFLENMTVIDSPGLNVTNAYHIKATEHFIAKADAVVWMMNAQSAPKSTEVSYIKKELDASLKPLVVVNKMDEIDDEEEDPEEILDAVRHALKGRITEVIGISAKEAYEGARQKNRARILASNFPAFQRYIEQEILPNATAYKVQRFLEKFAWNIHVIFNEEPEAEIEALRDKDYSTYVQKNMALGEAKEAVAACARAMKASLINFSDEKHNSVVNLMDGVAQLYGIYGEKNRTDGLAQITQSAAQNNLTAQCLLLANFLEAKEIEKASYWASILAKRQVSDKEDRNYISHLLIRFINLLDAENVPYADKPSAMVQDVLKRLADIGQDLFFIKEHPEMAYSIYYWYDNKILHPSSVIDMVALLTIGAKEGNALAQSMLGQHYENEGQIDKALPWYQKAAEQGEVNAQFQLGSIYHEKEDYTQAFYWIVKAAKQGNIDAKWVVGLYYKKGLGVKKNLELAFKYLKEAAKAGYIDAMYELADFYHEGVGTNKNLHKALYWCEKVARKGNAEAQLYLALMYHLENEIKDDEAAFYWFQKAADQDNARAMAYLGESYLVGRGCDKNEHKAYKYLQKAAEKNDELGLYGLGTCYEVGTGVKKDLQMAVKYFKMLAEKKDYDAQLKLADLLCQGIPQKDYVQAFIWYQKAAEGGSKEAKLKLAACYEDGQGTPKNLEKAFHVYASLAEDNDQYALYAAYKLALFYEHGWGCQTDLRMARKMCVKVKKGDLLKGWELYARYNLEGIGKPKDFKKAFHIYSILYKDKESVSVEDRIDAHWGMMEAYALQSYVHHEYLLSGEEEKNEIEWLKGHKGVAHADKILNYIYAAKEQWEKIFERNVHGAIQGAQVAMQWLAKCGQFGVQSQDDVLMANCYRVDAEAGNKGSMNMLGRCYEEGVGVGKDLDTAKTWYEKAAMAGLPEAQFNLGLVLLNQDGAENESAKQWLLKAANNHLGDARYILYRAFPGTLSEETKEGKIDFLGGLIVIVLVLFAIMKILS